jgi:D-beta-D-heptose 7-phosphate kinase/D-beta-D-heptose 1-phosphate adenosyltransferase
MSDGDEQNRVDCLKRLKLLLDDIDGSKVTLIGDTMLDRYHHGFANNLNSTAPVPVMKVIRSEESPGASAHIALGLNSLGMDVRFHCCVGDDPEGTCISEMLSNEGISTEQIVIVRSMKTLTKIRFYGSRESLLEKSQILLQADRGPLDPLSSKISEALTTSALKSLKDSCALVISDYDKGVIDESGSHLLIREAHNIGIPIIVDPKLTGLEKSRNATVVLFEIRGLELLRRRSMLDDSRDTAAHLIESYGWDSLVVLGGVNGVTLYQSDGSVVFFPCMSLAPEQQIGLHDAAATALAAALGHGYSMTDATTLAAAACECVLTAESSHEFVDKDTLRLWLDELAWQMQISER